MRQTREEIVAGAIGDGGNTTRGREAIEALSRAGFAIQFPPTDAVPLIASLRQRGLLGDADAVEALTLELDKLRRGWGPSTPTVVQQAHANLWTARRYMETAYGALIELNTSNYTHDDVEEANAGSVEAIKELWDGMGWINECMRQPFQASFDIAQSKEEVSP